MFDDVGHGWAQDKPADIASPIRRASPSLNSVMLPARRPADRRRGHRPDLPGARPPRGRPSRAAPWPPCPHGHVQLTGPAAPGGDLVGRRPRRGERPRPRLLGRPLCDALPAGPRAGHRRLPAAGRRPSGPAARGVGRLGPPARSPGATPSWSARLWDVAPDGATRQIVAMGVYRPAGEPGGGTAAGAQAADHRLASSSTQRLRVRGR